MRLTWSRPPLTDGSSPSLLHYRVMPIMGLPYGEPYATDATMRGRAATATFFAAPRGWQRV